MLDPELQEELKNANRTALVLHIAMLIEPLVYVIVALVLREVSDFRGLEESPTGLALMRSLFILLSILVIPAIVLLKRVLFSPDRIVSGKAGMHGVAMAYTRAQMIVDALAAVPATLGFVMFLIGGSMDYLVMLSTASVAMLILLFPKSDTLENTVMDRMLRGETVHMVREEPDDNA